MLYIVSGASRAGKSLIAKKILQERQIPYMTLDWIMMGFTVGLPEYGIHDKLMPDEIAGKMWRFVKPIFENMVWSGIDYVVEGEAILPELIKEFSGDHPDSMEVCFVGFTDIDIDQKLKDIREHKLGKGDWLNQEDDGYIRRHIENMVNYSKFIQQGCEQHNLRYIDTSKDFLESIEEATSYLFRNRKP